MSIPGEACDGYQSTLEIVGKRWTGSILLAITMGARRFGEILRTVDGLSDRLLSQRLKELEGHGLVIRTVVPTTPVQIRYTLSDSGTSLLTILQPLARWGAEHEARHKAAAPGR
ncbi:MAG TPA: helix-turn-helix domain-containing protein [Pseudonocardiaceae bacterium]|nr:helix-turn-helix domain-containing protein [Pseudonocardiaceae bacterium]